MTSDNRQAKSGRLRWLLAGAVVIACAAGGYAWYRAGEAKLAPQFRTAKVVRGPITASVSASGTLNAVVSVQVGSQVSGQIKEVLVDYNSEVRQGQLIARIDPETFEYRVRQAQADVDASNAQVLTAQANVSAARASVSRAEVNVAEAKRDLDRKQMLVERNFISPAELEKARAVHAANVEDVKSARAQQAVAEAQSRSAEANVKQREAQLQQARIDLERTSIRAPVNGIVIKKSVDAGQTVAASLQAPELFVIAQSLTDMQVDASIDEAEIGKIRAGQRATFTVDSFPGRSFGGEVRQVRKAAQTVQNVVTYTVVVSAHNPDLALVPGMTANVRIVTETRDAVLKVPNAALRFRPPNYQEPGGAPAKAALDAPTLASAALQRLLAAASGLLPAAQAQQASPLAQFRERLDRELSPSDAQKQELDAIFASAREKFAALREAPESERAKLVERHRAELRERVGQVLNPEQKKRYAQMLAEIAARQAPGGAAPVGGTPAAAAAAGQATASATAATGGDKPGGDKPGDAKATSQGSPGRPPAVAESARPAAPSSAAAPAGPASGPGSQLRQFRERLERELQLTETQRQQLDAIFAGMREKFASVREAPEADRPKIVERNRAELRERIAEILTAEQKPKYAAMVAEIAGRQSSSGRLFVMDADGKPRAVDVRAGLTDGSFTEVSGGNLKEGDDVIIGMTGATQAAPKASQPSGPRLPF